MKPSCLSVLSETELVSIHNASLDILAHCGVRAGSRRLLDLLKGKGFDVDFDRAVVRFPRARIEEALSAIPPRFDVFDREGRFAFTLGDGIPKIAAGHNAVFWLDSETGRTRPSRVEDVARFARICQRLEGIDMIGIPVMPQDVPRPEATLLYGVKAVMEQSSKPLFFSTDNARINRGVIELMRAVFPGDLTRQTYGISQLSPTSPLYWEEGVLEAIMDMLDTGVPIAVLPEPIAGVSAPYTLAGLITLNNVECLSGLVMIQALKPGAKVLYANSWTTTDMRSGAALVGSVETTLCRVAGAQLARFYKTPSHTTAPNSDSHAHDEQNSWEKTFSMFASVAAGHDLIVNCGMFATGMTCSHEQLIMDEEIAAMSKRIAAGILVNRDTIACDLIKEIGPRGDFMTAPHTLEWLHSGEYLLPQVAVRGPRALWEAAGSKDTYQTAREKVRQYKQTAGCPLSADRSAKLAELERGWR